MIENKRNIIIEVHNLTVGLKGNSTLKLVDDISFSLKENTITALLGKSGSGKTLTALSIMGLVNYIEGIEVEGRLKLKNYALIDLKSNSTNLRKLRGELISMIFQDTFTSFNPSKKCGVQLEEIASYQDASSKKTKNDILKFMSKIEVDERLYYSYPHEMSGGQLQRMGIIAALITNPVLLIADEPTTNLDASSRKEVLDLLLKVKNEFGKSILYISHDLDAVRYVADEIILMKKGELVKDVSKFDFFTRDKGEKEIVSDFDSIIARNSFDIGANSILEINNLSKSFSGNRYFPFTKHKKHDALVNVSFDVKEGDIFGVVGESGSGKTTIARLILNLIPPDSGDILFEGKPVVYSEKDSDFRNDVQIVFQNPLSSLNPALRIRKLLTEAVLSNKREKNISGIDEKILCLLSMVGLPETILAKTSAQISGGEGQRVAIARALALSPKLLILDESISSLDREMQFNILKLLLKLKKKHGLTYIFITHDLEVSRAFCNRLIILKEGRVVESGDVEEIFSKPKHSYTKKLLMSNLQFSDKD